MEESKALPINIGFEKITDKHKIYQLTPDMTIDNVQANDELVRALHQVNKDLKKRIKRNGLRLSYQTKEIATYEIYLSKQQIKFTLAVPSKFDTFIVNKIKSSWKNVGINETDDYIDVFENDETLQCELKLEKHFFLSLVTDKRRNAPLDSILNASTVLLDDDKMLFQLLLEPVNNWWHILADEKYNAYRNGKDVFNDQNLFIKAYNFIYDNIIEYIIDFVTDILDVFLGMDSAPKRNMRKFDDFKPLREIKEDKTMYDGFNARIRLFSYSKDEVRRRENLNSLIVAFRTLDANNALKPGSFDQVIKIKREKGKFSFLYPQILSTKEVQQIIGLPNRAMQREYKQLKSIANKQTDLPAKAFNGGIKMGLYNNKGNLIPVNFSSNLDDLAQSKILVCSQGGGKTTFMQNYTYECYKNNQPVIVIDYVQDCEMTNELIPYIDKDKLVVYNLHEMTNGDYINGIGYNELNHLLQSDNPRERLRGADMIASQLCILLNGVTFGATEELSSQMLKFLMSACRVVFSTGKAKIMDVYYCLEDVETRQDYIDKALASGVYTSDHVDIKNMEYLTKDDKGILTTKTADIKGVLNRFAGIQSVDLRLLELFSNPVNEELNFNKHIDENKIVFIQIPQTEFTDDTTRDILTTFFATKLWMTCQTRRGKDLKLTHLLLDEVRMIPNTSHFLSRYITEFRRHRLSTLFACHNLNQFQSALSSINSSGSNLFIMSGVKREAIRCIEDDLINFDWDEIKDLKKRHALVTTNYDAGKYEFIIKLEDKFFKKLK